MEVFATKVELTKAIFIFGRVMEVFVTKVELTKAIFIFGRVMEVFATKVELTKAIFIFGRVKRSLFLVETWICIKLGPRNISLVLKK
jgi:hypothetical protein